MKPAAKAAKLSAVISTKTMLPLHRRRLEFALRLKKRLGDRFDLYGRGLREISDKRQSLDGYRYHLALENWVEGHYWTEKLADPLLGWALPLYCGSPAAEQYFPEGAFIRLDLNDDLDQTQDQVVRILDEDPYERHLSAIAEARRRVIEDYPLPVVISRVIANRRGDASSTLAEPKALCSNEAAKPLHVVLADIPRRWKGGLVKAAAKRRLDRIRLT